MADRGAIGTLGGTALGTSTLGASYWAGAGVFDRRPSAVTATLAPAYWRGTLVLGGARGGLTWAAPARTLVVGPVTVNGQAAARRILVIHRESGAVIADRVAGSLSLGVDAESYLVIVLPNEADGANAVVWDDVSGLSAGLDVPVTRAHPVVPSDGQDLPFVSRALYIGGYCPSLAVLLSDSDQPVIFQQVTPGTWLWVQVRRVLMTGSVFGLPAENGNIVAFA